MVPTTASEQGTQVIQKETVGGTTYFYTDNTPAPMSGMVCAARRTTSRRQLQLLIGTLVFISQYKEVVIF